MIRLAAIAIGLCGLATPSLATEWISCSAADGGASMDILVGAVDVLSISGMTVTVGDKVWATDPAYGPGDPTSVGQAFEDTDTLQVDAVDADYVKIAELRLFKASEGDSYVSAGTLRLPGHGAWAVSCTGP